MRWSLFLLAVGLLTGCGEVSLGNGAVSLPASQAVEPGAINPEDAAIFKKLDVDKSGYLTPVEFIKGSINPSLPPGSIEMLEDMLSERFRRLDRNDDHVLTPDEFKPGL